MISNTIVVEGGGLVGMSRTGKTAINTVNTECGYCVYHYVVLPSDAADPPAEGAVFFSLVESLETAFFFRATSNALCSESCAP